MQEYLTKWLFSILPIDWNYTNSEVLHIFSHSRMDWILPNISVDGRRRLPTPPLMMALQLHFQQVLEGGK